MRLTDLISGELDNSEVRWLVVPDKHWALLTRKRAMMILNRVRLLALLFAVLTPLWCGVDLVVFPFPLWLDLAISRFVASAMFACLLLYSPRGRLVDAYGAMALLFAIPTLFFIISYMLLGRYHLNAMSAAMGAGYAFLPFVLVAGFSIFPLTLAENLIFASPVLAGELIAGFLRWPWVSWPSFAGAFWLLLLITGVSALAGMSQLAFMIALVRQAIHDPVTGIFSRRSGEEMLDLQMAQACRNNLPLTVGMIDLDHFKEVNDRFGHEAGDRILREFAKTVGNSLRRGDIFIRWGGEEFLLVLSNADFDQAARALKRVREHGSSLRPDGSPITASIGLAERIADHSNDWKPLVEMADARMYLAKQRGRDQVVFED